MKQTSHTALTVNYLNQNKIGFWVNDQSKIFGTKGVFAPEFSLW